MRTFTGIKKDRICEFRVQYLHEFTISAGVLITLQVKVTQEPSILQNADRRISLPFLYRVGPLGSVRTAGTLLET